MFHRVNLGRVVLASAAIVAAAVGCNGVTGSNGSSSHTSAPSTTPPPAPPAPPTSATPVVPIVKPPTPPPPPPAAPATVPRFLYAANPGDCSIDQFSIDKTTGAITQVNTPVNTGSPTMYAWALALDPSQKFLYATALDMPSAMGGGPWTWTTGNVTSWSIDPTTGALSSTPVATYTAATGPSMAIVPSGKFLIVADQNHDLLTVLALDGKGGLGLATSTNLAGGSGPRGVAVDAKGAFAYVTCPGNNSVSAFAIGSTGSLTAVGAPVAAGKGAQGLSITPDGAHLVVANCTDNTISTFSIASTGGITAVANSAVTVGIQPNSTAVHPSGKWVYATNYNNVTSFYLSAVTVLDLDPTTGLLSNPVASNAELDNVVAVDPTGSFAYAGIFQDIFSYTIDPKTGQLTQSGSFGNITKTLTGSFNEPIVSFVMVE